MATALYFPFSRCLDMLQLKQAVLVYEKLLFVDPESSDARATLYAREQHSDKTVVQKWLLAQDAYEVLEYRGIVETVSKHSLPQEREADECAEYNIAGDLAIARTMKLFRGQHHWQMLESRVPPAMLRGLSATRRTWAPSGETVVSIPYAQASSLTTTYALALADEHQATPFTDSPAHQGLMIARLQQAASVSNYLTALVARPAAPSKYRRQRIVLGLLDALAPEEELNRMPFEEVLAYRRDTAASRAQFNSWVDQINAKLRSDPWAPALHDELLEIAEHAKQISLAPGRIKRGTQAASLSAVSGAFGLPTVVQEVVTDTTFAGAVALGALGATAAAGTAFLLAAVKRRTPEQNAASYLLNARHR